MRRIPIRPASARPIREAGIDIHTHAVTPLISMILMGFWIVRQTMTVAVAVTTTIAVTTTVAVVMTTVVAGVRGHRRLRPRHRPRSATLSFLLGPFNYLLSEATPSWRCGGRVKLSIRWKAEPQTPGFGMQYTIRECSDRLITSMVSSTLETPPAPRREASTRYPVRLRTPLYWMTRISQRRRFTVSWGGRGQTATLFCIG